MINFTNKRRSSVAPYSGARIVKAKDARLRSFAVVQKVLNRARKVLSADAGLDAAGVCASRACENFPRAINIQSELSSPNFSRPETAANS